ncbi:MAG: FadR/GntR family transcriptional regulator [Vulcanimicrobiaceae bacterium]
MASNQRLTAKSPSAAADVRARMVREIAGRIVSGAWQSGTALPSESTLCTTFGISRSSLREALRVLAEKGLIEVRHGFRTRVRSYECWDFLDAVILSARRDVGSMPASVMRELFEAGAVIESAATALAARRALDEDCERLATALQNMQRSMSRPARFGLAALEFHRALLQASGNRVLMRMADPIRELLGYTLPGVDAPAEALQRTFTEHATIFKAISEHDVEGASHAMRAYLASFEPKLAL